MPRKIAFIGPIPPPIGGVALANISVQKLVSENEPEAKILNYNTSSGLQNADLYKRKGFTEFFHFLKNIWSVLLLSIRNRIDVSNVFVVPNISFLREAVFILILKFFSKKLVIHLHAKTEGDYFLEGRRLKFFTKILSLGDVIFVLSERFHKEFYAKYINPSKLIVLENFIDYSTFDNKIQNKKVRGLYVGRISEKKGFMTLIDALTILGSSNFNLEIDVLGAFENETFEKEVCEKIKTHNINNFLFHGPQMGEIKYKYFKENSVFIFPSYFENSPIVLKEAIAGKMAIISSDIIENKNILETLGNTLFFNTKDADDLAKKLLQISNDNETLDKMMYASEATKDFDIPVAQSILKQHM